MPVQFVKQFIEFVVIVFEQQQQLVIVVKQFQFVQFIVVKQFEFFEQFQFVEFVQQLIEFIQFKQFILFIIVVVVQLVVFEQLGPALRLPVQIPLVRYDDDVVGNLQRLQPELRPVPLPGRSDVSWLRLAGNHLPLRIGHFRQRMQRLGIVAVRLPRWPVVRAERLPGVHGRRSGLDACLRRSDVLSDQMALQPLSKAQCPNSPAIIAARSCPPNFAFCAAGRKSRSTYIPASGSANARFKATADCAKAGRQRGHCCIVA